MKIEFIDFCATFLPLASVTVSVPSCVHHRLGHRSLVRDQMSTTLL